MSYLEQLVRYKKKLKRRFRPFKVLYLVQGQANRVKEYFHLNGRKTSDALFLTYDEPLKEATYFPNSTFATGRNKLMEEGRKLPPYDYYVFLDDDVVFKRGNWTLFEKKLKKWEPAIGVPVVPKTQYSIITFEGKPWEFQCFLLNDEQFLAIRKDIFFDNTILPYVTEFDHLSAWAACEIQQIMIQTFYQPYILQFNEIEVDNVMTGRHDNSDRTYKKLIRQWLEKEVGSFMEPWFYWEDWRGIDKGFSLNIFLNERLKYSSSFEDKINKIVGNTVLYKKRLNLS